MKRRYLSWSIIWCIMAAVVAGGCGPKPQEEGAQEKGAQEGQTQRADTSEEGRAQEPDGSLETGRQGEIEKNRQFADGFGLIEAESPRVYQLAEGQEPFTESSLARADLVSAVQQEGKFWFTAVITDHSVEEADAETVLAEAEHNPAYFKIEESGEDGQEAFYGYSPYLELINDAERAEPVQIKGKNIEAARYAPNRLTQKTSSLSRLPSGRFIMNFGYFMEDPYSCPGEPEGEYSLYLPGFEKPIVFQMEAAPALEDDQALPENTWGTAEGDKYKLFVRAEQKAGRIMAEVYTWSDQGYLVRPQKMKLYFWPSGTESGRILCPVFWENPYAWQEEPAAGSRGGVQGMQTVFDIPEEMAEELQAGKEGQFEAVIEGISLEGAGESKTVDIPVPRPGETKTLEQTVTFRDGQIRLLQVTAQQRTEAEKEDSGIDADTLLRVSAAAGSTGEQKFTFVLIGREGEEETVSYARTGWPEFSGESSGARPDAVMTGFSLFCSGSEESVRVRLYAPSYWCPETVIVPLEINNFKL